VRAWKVTGDPWAEDPGCYLTNHEIGLDDADARSVNAPFEPIPVVEEPDE
jgi:hypothetical protein